MSQTTTTDIETGAVAWIAHILFFPRITIRSDPSAEHAAILVVENNMKYLLLVNNEGTNKLPLIQMDALIFSLYIV